jgi:hypothetical protein
VEKSNKKGFAITYDTNAYKPYFESLA